MVLGSSMKYDVAEVVDPYVNVVVATLNKHYPAPGPIDPGPGVTTTGGAAAPPGTPPPAAGAPPAGAPPMK